MSRSFYRVSALIAATLLSGSATAGTLPDPALVFMSKMLLRDFTGAERMIEQVVGVSGTNTMPAAVFINTLRSCSFFSLINVSGLERIPPNDAETAPLASNLVVKWLCYNVLHEVKVTPTGNNKIRITTVGPTLTSPPPAKSRNN